MEIGNEISQKIRSAIKAKLVELRAYVDEELPDYIMVMVANKKSITQMTEDLSLFLGSNTDKFTTWLHGLLVKLQSITSDPISVPSKGEKTGKSSKSKDHPPSSSSHESKASKSHGSSGAGDAEGKAKRRSLDDEADSKKDSKRRRLDSDKVQPIVSEQASSKVASKVSEEVISVEEPVVPDKSTAPQVNAKVEVLDDASEPPKAETAKVSSTKAEAPKESASTINIEEDDFSELLLTENDELTEELDLEPAVVPTSKKPESKASTGDGTARPRKDPQSVTITLPDLSTSHSSGNRPKAVTSPIRQTTRRTASVRPVESRPSELFTRKRRGPVSVVASISREVEEEDDDDGYDPYNPAVGSVASVIKVTARKSSVPPKLQASKSLLLKAMSEAEKSIESQRRVAITPVRPFMRSDRKEREQEQERSPRASCSSVKENHASPRLARSSLQQVISQPKPSRKAESPPPIYIPTRKVQPAPRGDISDRLGIVSKSKREEAHLRLGKPEKGEAINFVIKREVEDPDVLDLDPSPVKKTVVVQEVKGKKVKESGAEIDSRVVECEPESVPSSTEEDKSVGSGSQGIPEILEDVEPDEFVLDPDIDTMESSGLYEEDKRLVDMKEKQKDKTRFVVTLDGVDEEVYEMGVMESQDESMEIQPEEVAVEGESVMSLGKESTALNMHRSPPKVKQFSISLKDSDEEAEPMQEEPTPLMRAKMMERCKFWPACVNGAACEYHHPTVPCKTFPQCKFGDKCLYIHPNCRFDSKCLRPDCPYTHSSRRSVPPVMMPMYRPTPPPPPPVAPVRAPLCKFFPMCSNMACPFYHPKPCRFGVSCKNKERSCPFYHPALPTKDKLKWEAGKATSGGDVSTPRLVM